MKHSRRYLSAHFSDLIARAGLSQRAVAQRAGLSCSTIMGLVHPAIHPGRRSSMQRRTAWRIAKAYADVAGIAADLAFRTLVIEERQTAAAEPPQPEGTPHDTP